MISRFRMAGCCMLMLSCLSAGVRAAELVDINTASVAELMHLPGMTAIWAARIVRFRPYRRKLDLLNHGVVSADVYARIKDGVVANRAGK